MKKLFAITLLGLTLTGCAGMEFVAVDYHSGHSYGPHAYPAGHVNYSLGYYSSTYYNGYRVYGDPGYRYYYAPPHYAHHRHYSAPPVVVHNHIHTPPPVVVPRHRDNRHQDNNHRQAPPAQVRQQERRQAPPAQVRQQPPAQVRQERRQAPQAQQDSPPDARQERREERQSRRPKDRERQNQH